MSTKKVTLSISEEIWNWWQGLPDKLLPVDGYRLKLSQVVEREMRRIREDAEGSG